MRFKRITVILEVINQPNFIWLCFFWFFMKNSHTPDKQHYEINLSTNHTTSLH